MDNMNIFIRSTGNISPQYSGEPDYASYIDPKMIRRMSRIIKMGVVSAIECLKNAGIDQPGAILTATAYGCLEDSSQFLRRMIEFEEKMLSPTAFIQSTHNTVGAQIALLLKCHQYNNTIVHRAFSFENALIESALLLLENFQSVLTGAADENTNDLQMILSRFGVYRSSADFPGEGAFFFLLEKNKPAGALALLKTVTTFYGDLQPKDLKNLISETLQSNNMSIKDIDLILKAYRDENKNLPTVAVPEIQQFSFRHLCGDFPTSSAFGLMLATEILSKQRSPEKMRELAFPLNHILLYVQNDKFHHSLMLISTC